MAANSTVQITLDWSDRDLEPEESEEQGQQLIEALLEVLINPAIGDFAAENAIVLPNPERQSMEDAIYTLSRRWFKLKLKVIARWGFPINLDNVSAENNHFCYYSDDNNTNNDQHQLFIW